MGLSLAIVDDVVVGDDDFIGVQNYERIPYDGTGPIAPEPGTPLNQMGSAIEPLSLGGSVRYAHGATEPSLAGLLDVMDTGVPVLGYLHWTLMDNFEWVSGFCHQLGLHEVDRETFARTPKPSARVYAAYVHAAGA